MNLLEMRAAVREQLDLDEGDLPNGMVDLYLDEGFQQTLNVQARWPFFETKWTAESTADGEPVTLPADVDSLASVLASDLGALANVPHDQAEEYFLNDQGAPEMWSVWGGQLYLWPADAAARTLTLRGWRLPTSWQSAGALSVPDCDERLHRPMIHYATYRAYAQQEDEVFAPFWRDTWARTADSARTAIMRPEFQGLWRRGEGLRSGRRRAAYRLVA